MNENMCLKEQVMTYLLYISENGGIYFADHLGANTLKAQYRYFFLNDIVVMLNVIANSCLNVDIQQTLSNVRIHLEWNEDCKANIHCLYFLFLVSTNS